MSWTLARTVPIPFVDDDDPVTTQKPAKVVTFRVRGPGTSVVRLHTVVVDANNVRKTPAGSIDFSLADVLRYSDPKTANTNTPSDIVYYEAAGTAGTHTVGDSDSFTLSSGEYTLRLHNDVTLPVGGTKIFVFLEIGRN